MKNKRLTKHSILISLIALVSFITVVMKIIISISDNNEVSLQNKKIVNQSLYQTNMNGQTFGPNIYNNSYIGNEPDLIAAYGIDGTFGYVLATDFDSNPCNPTEAIAQQNKNGNLRVIPLYDKDGETVIGEFVIKP